MQRFSRSLLVALLLLGGAAIGQSPKADPAPQPTPHVDPKVDPTPKVDPKVDPAPKSLPKNDVVKAVITAPKSVRAGDDIVLRADDSVGEWFQWEIVEGPQKVATEVADFGGRPNSRFIVRNAPAGTYEFALHVGSHAKITWKSVTAKVSVVGGDPAPAPQDDPTPPTPDTSAAKAVAMASPNFPSGSIALVDATGSQSADPLDFSMVGLPNQPMVRTDGGMGAIFIGLKDGQYFVSVTATAGKDYAGKRTNTAVVGFTVGSSPAPDPKPDPTPDPIPVNPPAPPPAPPSPAPAGFTGHVHATLVFDVDEPSTAQLRASPVKADLTALNASWYVAPTAGPIAKLFAAYTTADGLPTVYFTDDSGKLLDRLKAPTTEAQVIDKLKTIRGTN